jgi:dsRNA-specific ribonuclease
MLHKLARFLGLGEFLLLAPLVERLTFISANKGRNSPRLYEDVFESLCGAIIEDFGDEQGYPIVKRFVLSVVESQIDFAELILQNENHKDTLQRYFQRLKWANPQYEDLHQCGPSHTRSFTSGVFISAIQLQQLCSTVQENVKRYHQDVIKNAPQTVKGAILAVSDKTVDATSANDIILAQRLETQIKSVGIVLDDSSIRTLASIMSTEIGKYSSSVDESTTTDTASDDNVSEEDTVTTINKFLNKSVTIDKMSSAHAYYLIGIGTANKKLEAQQSASRQALANLGIDVNWNV